MEKKVSGTRLKPWQAILLILAVAAFLFVAQFALTGLQFLLDRSGLLAITFSATSMSGTPSNSPSSGSMVREGRAIW